MIKTGSNLIYELIKHLPSGKKILGGIIVAEWDEIVGKPMCEHAKAEKVRNGILYISVSNSAWRNEIYFQKDFIVAKANDYVKESIVKDVKFL